MGFVPIFDCDRLAPMGWVLTNCSEMYLKPDFVLGYRPTISKAICLKGTPIIGRECNGAFCFEHLA